MIEVIGAFIVGSGRVECSTSGVQERERASDVIMLKLKGALGLERLVTLRVESGVAGHLQKFQRLPKRYHCQLRVSVHQNIVELLGWLARRSCRTLSGRHVYLFD